MGSENEVPRTSGAFVHDKRFLLAAFVPFFLAGMVPWFTTEIFTTGPYLLLMALIVVTFPLPATMLWASIEESKRGFTRGHTALCLSYLCAPPLLVTTLLALTAFLDLISAPQAMWTAGIVLFATLPAALLGTVKVLQNRKLPHQNP